MIVDMLVEIRSTVLALGGEKRGDTMKLWTMHEEELEGIQSSRTNRVWVALDLWPLAM